LIQKCNEKDFETIYSIVNEAASIYKGIIPSDLWKDPYMSRQELQHEITQGVHFWGFEENQRLLGVMGIQVVEDVPLIRHAYVRNSYQKQGICKKLLTQLRAYLTTHTGRYLASCNVGYRLLSEKRIQTGH
jgi:Acetyltransferase (GNAT) domain